MTEIRADIIKKALADRAKSRQNIFFTEVYTNDGEYYNQRFDGVEFHGVHNTKIYGYEIKVARGDFLQDGKWTGYLNFCNEFSFVCPEGLIKENELPLEIGLIYYKENGRLRVKRRPVAREIKPPFKMIAALLFNRVQEERHPFFSDEREKIIAYLADKEIREKLSVEFKNKLISERDQAVEENQKVQNDFTHYKKEAENWEKVKVLLRKHGIYPYHIIEETLVDIENAIMAGSSPKMYEEITEATRILNRLTERLRGGGNDRM